MTMVDNVADEIYGRKSWNEYWGKLDGNGPLYNSGNGPYAAAPRNLLDEYTKSMPDGQMFYSITYGKGQMGPYGPQVSTTQRWMIVNYIRSKQGKLAGAPNLTPASRKSDSTAAAGVNTADTTAAKQGTSLQ
jgi:hypothetical protein